MVIDTHVNAITVSKVGTWVYLHEFRIEVVDPLSFVHLAIPDQVQTLVAQATPGSEVALASVPQHPGGQPLDVISTNDVSMCQLAIKHLASLQTGTVPLTKGLRVILHNACKAWGIISARVGVDLGKRVEAESFASFALQEFNDNDTSLVFICRYLTTFHEVMGRSKTATEQPSARGLEQQRLDAVCS